MHTMKPLMQYKPKLSVDDARHAQHTSITIIYIVYIDVCF